MGPCWAIDRAMSFVKSTATRLDGLTRRPADATLRRSHLPRAGTKRASRFPRALGVSGALLAFTATPALADPMTHDDFLLRLSLGVGAGTVNETLDAAGQSSDLRLSGLAALLELHLGGTPVEGLSVGGLLSAHSVVDSSPEIDGEEAAVDDTSFGVTQIAAFVNYYPNPKAGLYVLGTVGYGSGELTVNDIKLSPDTQGVVLGIGVGYDFWVSREWSLGPGLRFNYAHLTGEDNGLRATDDFTTPIVTFSGTYH